MILIEPEIFDWNCWFRTCFAASVTVVVHIIIGVNEGLSAVLLSQLNEEDSFIRLTSDEETWVASLGLLMAPVSAILVGPFIDAFGRKLGLVIFFLNMGLGLGIIASARDVTHLYIGRVICAFGEGFKGLAVVYAAEICTEKQRAFVFTVIAAFFSGGVLLITLIGSFLRWNFACFAFSVACFAYSAFVWLIPESPAWLFRRGRENDAARSLKQLGRSTPAVIRELEALRLRTSNAEKIQLRTFLQPTVWKPFVILAFFHLLQFATGVYDIIYYQAEFVENLGTTYDADTVSLFVSIVRFLSGATIGIYFKTISRKSAVALSGFLMALALLGTGTYEYTYRNTAVAERTLQWLPLGLTFLYIAASTLGVISIPWLMCGEVYPLRVRGIMSSATLVVAYSTFFVFVKTYHAGVDAFAFHGVIFIFSGSSALLALYALFILPETQNKSLQEVERGFETKKRPQELGVKMITRF